MSTEGALKAFNDLSIAAIRHYIYRHLRGDWGDLDQEDVDTNMRALANGERLMSVHTLPTGAKIWIITEADRSSTTILLADEY